MSESELTPLRDRSKSARKKQLRGIARHGKLPRSRVWKTLLGIVGGTCAVLMVATAATAGIYLSQLSNHISENSVDINNGVAVQVPTIGAYEGGFNMLIVGSDENWDRDSVLNDVNILIHVAEDQSSAVAVSIPRDLVVPFPACINQETGRPTSPMAGRPINEALFYGGLPCAVTVVENLTGVDVQFAGMIGFDGVVAMSEAVGGVNVCVTSPIHDKYVWLDLEAGEHELRGEDALKFLRSRHGVGNASDLTRISSQQVFLSALIRKLKAEETLSNVGTLMNLANVAANNMTLSSELANLNTMIAMARALDRISMDRIVFVQYPGTTGGEGIYAGKLQPQTRLANELFAAILADQPVGVEQAGDNMGSTLDPNTIPELEDAANPDSAIVTTAGEIESELAPSSESNIGPSITPEPTPEPEVKIIPGLRGQSAADHTCTIGN